MQRVAALFLPMWPLDRLRRAERTAAPPEAVPVSLEAMQAAAAEEQRIACSVPRGGGWRPGARWARQDWPLARHEAGRREEPVGHPFGEMAGASPPKILPELVSGRGTVREANGGGAGEVLPKPLHPRLRRRSPSPSELGEDLEEPRVTTIRTANRVEIAAACPRALALGVVPGMALTQARAQTPGLDVRQADPEGDLAALRALAVALAQRWSPMVAVADAQTLFLDLTGVAHLHGGEARMAARLVRLLARLGFAARVAVADTPGAAWALARHRARPVLLCPPGGHGKAIAPLPVTALRIEGKAVELLRRLGVDTIGQLAALPRGPLVKRFGAGVALAVERALGTLPEPLDPVSVPEPIRTVRRFAEPIATPEAIAHWLGTMVPGLCEALALAGLGARAIELVADRVDGVPQRIRIGLARTSRDPAHLLRLLMRRIEQVEPGYGIDVMTLHVRRAEPLEPQPVEERLDEEAAPDLAPLVDTLATRIGTGAMWRAAPVESDVPERSAARAPVLDPPPARGVRLKADDVRRLAPGEAPVWRPDWPRPARLLQRPERIDHVMAELPDHAPRRFTWRGTVHKVVRADGPERIQGEWWKRRSEIGSVRDYFRVEDEEGRRYWLFRRGDGERPETGDLSWYLHGVFG